MSILNSFFQSPVLAAVNGAFAGLVSIRAYGAQAMFIDQCMEKVDTYTHVSQVFYNLNRQVYSLRTNTSYDLCYELDGFRSAFK
jgi:hypothetical protein